MGEREQHIPMADDKDVVDISLPLQRDATEDAVLVQEGDEMPDRTKDTMSVDDMKDALDDAIDRVDDLGGKKRTEQQSRDVAIDAARKKIDAIFTESDKKKKAA